MPLMVLTASSILSVTSVSTCSGAAPGSRVVTDRRDVDVREAIDAQPAEREQADHGQREDQHPGERPGAGRRVQPATAWFNSPSTTRAPSRSCADLDQVTRPAWPIVTMRSSTRSPATTNTRRGAGDRLHGRAGTSTPASSPPARSARWRRGPASAGRRVLARPPRRRARESRHARRRDVAHLPGEGLAGIRVHLERHGAPTATAGDVLRRHGELDTQRVHAHHRGDLGAARDVVAHRHEPLADHAGERRAHDGVGDRPPKIWDNGFRQITSSTREIKTPEDLKNFKIRVPPAPILTSLFKALDAGPSPINFNELYSSLQTKVVDGQENPLPIIATTRLYEVQKSCSLTGHVWDGYWILGNKRAWERLPQDVRDVVTRELDRSAVDERADIAKLSESLRQELSARASHSSRSIGLRSGKPLARRPSTRSGRASSATRLGPTSKKSSGKLV